MLRKHSVYVLHVSTSFVIFSLSQCFFHVRERWVAKKKLFWLYFFYLFKTCLLLCINDNMHDYLKSNWMCLKCISFLNIELFNIVTKLCMFLIYVPMYCAVCTFCWSFCWNEYKEAKACFIFKFVWYCMLWITWISNLYTLMKWNELEFWLFFVRF